MRKTVDQDVLEGFIEEAQGYLPTLWDGVEALCDDPNQPEVMEEVHRHVHTIKGAASMVGLAGLSHIAFHLEATLEAIAEGHLTVEAQTGAFLRQGIAAIVAYLEGLTNDTLREAPIVREVVDAYRRLHGLPAEDTPAYPAEVSQEPSGNGGSKPASPAEGPQPREEISQENGPQDTAEDAPPPEPVAPELVETFYLEAEEHLHTMVTRLAALDKDRGQRDYLQDIRRSVHTIKGAASMVGFPEITQLAHRMEDLLDALYEGQRAFDDGALDLLFTSTDALEDMIRAITVEEGSAQSIDTAPLYEAYEAMLASTTPAPESSSTAVEAKLGEETLLDLAKLGLQDQALSKDATAPTPRSPRAPAQVVRVPIERLDELVNLVSELVITRTAFEQRMGSFNNLVEDLQFSLSRLRHVSTTLETDYEVQALNRRVPVLAGGTAISGPDVALISRDIHGFDDLEFDRYTEFHLLSRELSETVNDIRTLESNLRLLIGDVEGTLNRQSRLSSDIQEKLMRARMVPLATLSTRLHRAVRQLAREQGKLIDLVVEGEEIELDKTVLEEMADPLLHLLRNAVDHGIEPPALRQVMGKPERGTIYLRAAYRGNQVIITIQDDGGGLEPETLRAVAVNKGYLSEADAGNIPDEDLYALVFLPGFSTATEVSKVSGRGVGLDVVRTNVHKLKGTVTLEAIPGEGTTFTIQLPMTLAITRALLVKAQGETFAIPLNAVTQILRLDRETVEHVGHEPVVRIGDQVHPMVRLKDALHLTGTADATIRRFPVLILNTGSGQVALVVDELVAGREIVVKTLGNHLRRVHGISGATLMGDGQVVLILNPAEMMTAPDDAKARRWTIPASPSGTNHAGDGITRAGNARKIMVVDDSVSVRSVISTLIEKTGWQPIAAKDGLEALEAIQRAAELPDLILLDIEMPRMDGYELITTLQSHDVYRKIPVVMLTSRAANKHRSRALELGASGYVTKPYQDDHLIQIIRELIESPKTE